MYGPETENAVVRNDKKGLAGLSNLLCISKEDCCFYLFIFPCTAVGDVLRVNRLVAIRIKLSRYVRLVACIQTSQ